MDRILLGYVSLEQGMVSGWIVASRGSGISHAYDLLKRI